MLKLSYEFNGNTVMGFAHCEHADIISSDYKDYDTVETTVKTLVKFFSSKSLTDQCVTFSYHFRKENGDWVRNNCARIWKNYSGKFEGVVWNDDNCGVPSPVIEKMTAKDFRGWYLACATKAINTEWEVKTFGEKAGA